MIQAPVRLKRILGDEVYQQGETLFRRGGVRLTERDRSCLKYMVAGSPAREVVFTAESARCTCESFERSGACVHLAAATLLAQESGTLDEFLRSQAGRRGPKLLDAMEVPLPEDGSLRLEPHLAPEYMAGSLVPRLRISLRIGTDRLYVVRSIPQLIDAMDAGEPLDFGKGFTYEPEWMRFSPDALRLLRLLRALCAAQREAGGLPRGSEQRQLLLPEPFAEEALDALRGLSFRFQDGDREHTVRHIRRTRVPIFYKMSSGARALNVTARFPKELQPLTASFAFALIGDRVAEIEPEQRAMLRVLFREQYNGKSVFSFDLKESSRVIGELLPFLRLTGVTEIDGTLEKQLLRLPLVARVYLDREGKEITAKTRFCYGDREIDPFHPVEETAREDGKLLLHDAAAERRVVDALGSAGFHIRGDRVYLSGSDAVFDFVSGGVSALQTIAEVYLSRDFRRLTPRRPKLQGSMRMNGGWLELRLEDDGKPVSELAGLIEALSRRRRYFRLKDGTFLDLSDLSEWEELADNVWEAATAEDTADPHEDVLRLGACRAVWLDSLLGELPVREDESVRETVDALNALTEGNEAPKRPGRPRRLPEERVLRPYQRRGLHWLLTLDRLHMGGILADDMGLGKTVQVISALHATKEKGQVSIVVAPTSLTYNWLRELHRFAPDLSVLVMGGTGAQREAQAEHVRTARDVDVLITSYPLIRRDIDLLKDIPFRFAVLDEAQHIKNAGSVGAAAVKQLQAQSRFALTGTPMENGVGELWSIFDFVLPGYLLSYNAFLRHYQDGEDAEGLRRRIRPFLLRRLKKDVLTELPDKLESTMTAQMTPEQERVYRAAMLRLRDRVDGILTEKGFQRSRVEVLAAITELRQICCHPALVLPDYTGSAGKLELLLDTLPDAISAGRRVLLFSQFTSMLRILRQQLSDAGYKCLYLDGETPPQQRIALAEQFNGGDGQIFLISLKAGGTGLNLTGADTVIHYDPWWNPAAEEQATDRAYRIGQTRKVQVVRLVTYGSIEEQVVAMGQRKKALFDQLITPGEEWITALTEKDIRELFA